MASDASDNKPWDDVVLDTSAFIQGEVEPLRRISHRLWTVPQVLDEVRDKKAKQSASFALDVIPERIESVLPSKASLDFVVAFAKKTGDFQALSKTDLLVLALTHELRTKSEGQSGESTLLDSVRDAEEGEDDEDDESASQSTTSKTVETSSAPKPSPWTAAPRPLPPVPQEPVVVEQKPASSSGKHVMWSDEDFAVDGTVQPPKEAEEEWPSLTKALPVKENTESVSVWSKNVALESIKREQQLKDALQQESEALAARTAPKVVSTVVESVKKDVPVVVKSTQSRILKPQMMGIVESARAPSAADDDADLEWAGPGSQSTGWTHVSKKGGNSTTRSSQVQAKDTESPSCRVACSTADFACQNVLLQLKLGVVSLDGRRITQVKSWVSKCDACLRIFPADQKRLFCPQCGHASLSRLAYSTDASGQRRYHYSRSRRIKTQGNIFPIPRKADILLTEDQLLSGIWAQRAQRKQSNVSMFGADVNDAMGVDLRRTDASNIKVGYGSINPNARKGRERRGASKSKAASSGGKGKQ